MSDVNAGGFAPCPNCKERNATRVSFTWWGGFLGPKMMSVVQCARCSLRYNGKTGATLGTAIAIYMAVAFVIAGLLAVVILKMRR